MVKHYITKYSDEKNTRKAVSWIQLDILGKHFCFFSREIEI
ncbi:MULTISPECIES: hypothetical protein [unclassified Lactococcus]|nr:MULTISPECIES: hypothetical protein [unclassified Lactococcus]